MPDGADVESGRLWSWIHENVQIAAIHVLPAQNRTEHASITGAVSLDHARDRNTICIQGIGRFMNMTRQK
jgi:hypothetical protein